VDGAAPGLSTTSLTTSRFMNPGTMCAMSAREKAIVMSVVGPPGDEKKQRRPNAGMTSTAIGATTPLV
jgi:hypothetical protein